LVFRASSAWDGLGTTSTTQVALFSLSCHRGSEICHAQSLTYAGFAMLSATKDNDES